MNIPAAPATPIDAHGRVLMQLVGELKTRVTLERSFRLRPGAFLSNRFMFSLARRPLGADGHDRIVTLGRRLGMAERLVEDVSRYLPMAPYVHLGYENDGSASLYKLYLEFAAQDDAVEAIEHSGPIQQHLAFKWVVGEPDRHVVSRYLWYPGLSGHDVASRVADHLAGPDLDVPRGVALNLLASATSRISADDLHYMEVAEGGTARRSFDVNIYDAELEVAEVYPLLASLAEHFAIDARAFHGFIQAIGATTLGHLAAGLHRDGRPFFNVYYNVVKKLAEAPRVEPPTLDRRPPRHRKRTSPAEPTPQLDPPARRLNAFDLPGPARKVPSASPDRWEPTTPDDRYVNYCLWPYEPVASTEGKLRPVGLLNHSFELAGIGDRGAVLIDTLREAIGPFRTVFGIKWIDGRLAWEFYFYDYERLQREVSITRVLEALRPFTDCPVPVDETIPYFMFSLDIDEALARGGHSLEIVHAYIGNPGSTVSSGIAYALTRAGRTLENLYYFFDATRDLKAAANKVLCSAYVDASRVPIDNILWPELRVCHTICVANKRGNDTAYFSGVNVDQLLFFLKRLHYPSEIVEAVYGKRDRLDHLLFDVGFDYITRGDEVVILKSGYYGAF